MIEINLLPEELRVKAKSRNLEQAASKTGTGRNQDRLFIYAAALLLGIFILAHLFFAVRAIFENGRLVSLGRKWARMAPQKKTFDEFNKEFSLVSQDAGITRGLTSQRVLWAEKLNKLSLNLPAGVWFNDIAINNKNITIRGSVISLQKEEVSLINKLLDNLKEDTDFAKDFSVFELSSVQERSIGGYDIADFVLVGVLRTK